ncbi:MAG: lipase family protein [Chloroflexota bacterium]
MNQAFAYDEDLSYHFINLALAGEVQPIWESANSKHKDLDNLFTIPRDYYTDLFLACKTPIDDIYNDIHDYVFNYYEQVGAVRIGEIVIPDYEEIDANWTISEIETLENMLELLGSYSQMFTESLSNIRYNFSRLLMGYALRSTVDGHGVIVLRGTVHADEWFNNINYRLIPFHPLNADYGLVHNGFRDVYKGIRGRYRQLVNEFAPDVPLYLVGHSLGGAVTQLAALDVIAKSPERAQSIQVYTYASPRPGDPDFVRAYDEYVQTSYRIVNVCDMIPYMPFEELGSILNQTSYPYRHTKGELAFVHQAGNPVANHISSYHLATKMKVPAPMDASTPKRIE